jgi:hypothetical protein
VFYHLLLPFLFLFVLLLLVEEGHDRLTRLGFSVFGF